MGTADISPIIIKIITQPESIIAGVFFIVMMIFLNYVTGYDKNAQLEKRKPKPKKEKKAPPPPPKEAEEDEEE